MRKRKKGMVVVEKTRGGQIKKDGKAKVKVNECHLIPFPCNRRIDLEIFTQWCSGIPHTK